MKKSKETQGKKKLNKKMVIAAAGLLFTCGGLVACGTADTPKEYVVTMQSETDGFVSYSITVKEGVTISEIKNQIRSIDGYTLEGVYKDQACQQPYADTDVISANTTVYLKFIKDLDPEMLAKLAFTFVTDHYEVKAANSDIEGEVVIPGTYDDGENGLHPVTIPDGSYLTGAFYNCDKITSVVIEEGITKIGTYAFADCSKLTNVTISEGVTSIGEYAFYEAGLTGELILPNSLISIGASAFYYCQSLAITIPADSSLTEIGNDSFRNIKETIVKDSKVYENFKISYIYYTIGEKVKVPKEIVEANPYAGDLNNSQYFSKLQEGDYYVYTFIYD